MRRSARAVDREVLPDPAWPSIAIMRIDYLGADYLGAAQELEGVEELGEGFVDATGVLDADATDD